VAQDGGAAGIAAKLGLKAHRDMFQHACGFQLANQGTDTRTLQAYLGHRDIQHTVRYWGSPLARIYALVFLDLAVSRCLGD
jgi:site-specific recombinase XerD